MTARQVIDTILLEEKQWIRCKEGWISHERLPDGRYYVRATGHRAMTINPADIGHVLRELKQALGGESFPHERE